MPYIVTQWFQVKHSFRLRQLTFGAQKFLHINAIKYNEEQLRLEHSHDQPPSQFYSQHHTMTPHGYKTSTAEYQE